MNTDSIEMDQDFPRRVTRASLVVGIFLFFFLLGIGMGEALSYGLGAALGIYSFDVFRMGARVFIRTDEMKSQQPIPSWKKWVVSALFLMKVPLWVATIYVAIAVPYMPVLLFAGGLVTPQFVLASKAISKMVVSGSTTGDTHGSSTEYSIDRQTQEANVS